MYLYHSVAINIEIDLLEVLDLNQIANFFLRRMQARPFYVKVCIKLINQIVLACEKFCWLHVKIRETRPMGHKLTCGTNLANFQDFAEFNPNPFCIIIW